MNSDDIPAGQILEPPHAFIFSLRQCIGAYRLNQFAISLKDPVSRAAFLKDQIAAMRASGLTQRQIDMVAAKDWTGLIANGGHVLAIVKIAYTLGIMHHEVGAHMCGMSYDDLKRQLPREAHFDPALVESTGPA